MYNNLQNKKNIIIEDHPSDYTGYPFISLIQYKQQNVISIIDNIDDKHLRAYVLDLCGPEDVDEQSVILAANYWHENNVNAYPISIEFSKNQMIENTSKILKVYSLDMITRIVGPVYFYPINTVVYVKKRKRRFIPASLIQSAV